eukprot:TRINITY_DN8614_c0_g1_i3.p1 TRINITY_DN8614_c0_g1~~TRINITY_DN8614_c0_g1_i3.p1  ORF type:complete len:1093 (+),score=128.34 TRINITY_DN8614_c0_g1_i3:76-3354(+)
MQRCGEDDILDTVDAAVCVALAVAGSLAAFSVALRTADILSSGPPGAELPEAAAHRGPGFEAAGQWATGTAVLRCVVRISPSPRPGKWDLVLLRRRAGGRSADGTEMLRLATVQLARVVLFPGGWVGWEGFDPAVHPPFRRLLLRLPPRAGACFAAAASALPAQLCRPPPGGGPWGRFLPAALRPQPAPQRVVPCAAPGQLPATFPASEAEVGEVCAVLSEPRSGDDDVETAAWELSSALRALLRHRRSAPPDGRPPLPADGNLAPFDSPGVAAWRSGDGRPHRSPVTPWPPGPRCMLVWACRSARSAPRLRELPADVLGVTARYLIADSRPRPPLPFLLAHLGAARGAHSAAAAPECSPPPLPDFRALLRPGAESAELRRRGDMWTAEAGEHARTPCRHQQAPSPSAATPLPPAPPGRALQEQNVAARTPGVTDEDWAAAQRRAVRRARRVAAAGRCGVRRCSGELSPRYLGTVPVRTLTEWHIRWLSSLRRAALESKLAEERAAPLRPSVLHSCRAAANEKEEMRALYDWEPTKGRLEAGLSDPTRDGRPVQERLAAAAEARAAAAVRLGADRRAAEAALRTQQVRALVPWVGLAALGTRSEGRPVISPGCGPWTNVLLLACCGQCDAVSGMGTARKNTTAPELRGRSRSAPRDAFGGGAPPRRRSIQCVHAGGWGAGVAERLWPLLRGEHPEGSGPSAVFDVRMHANAVCFALEPGVVDQLRCGTSRTLYAPAALLQGAEGSGGLFPRGWWGPSSRRVVDAAVERLRLMAEESDTAPDVLGFGAAGGGCGGGALCRLLSAVREQRRSAAVHCFLKWPPRLGCSGPCSHLNALLALPRLCELADTSVLCGADCGSAAAAAAALSAPVRIPFSAEAGQRCGALTPSDVAPSLFPLPRQWGLRDKGRGWLPCGSWVEGAAPGCPPLALAAWSPVTTSGEGALYRALRDPSAALLQLPPAPPKAPAVPSRSLGALAVCCGGGPPGFWQLGARAAAAGWLPPAAPRLHVGSSPLRIAAGGPPHGCSVKGCLVLQSTTALHRPLQELRTATSGLLRRRAFLHWYLGAGLDAADFDEAAEYLTGATRSYAALAAPQ